MPEVARISLGTTALRGRLRQPAGPAQSLASSGNASPDQYISDIRPLAARPRQQPTGGTAGSAPLPRPSTALPRRSAPQVLPRPIADVYKPSKPQPVVRRTVVLSPPSWPPEPLEPPAAAPPATAAAPKPPEPAKAAPAAPRRFLSHYSPPQLALLAMACCVFAIGLAASIQTLLTNKTTTAQVAALSKQADKQSAGQSAAGPSTTKPSSRAYGQYAVAPDLPRYVKIPKLGVNARVLQVGVTTSGALGTPNNVYDTAWYTGSAKPGQPGATLIDGHVSSWTTRGAFYGLKTLVAGDTIQIVRGDGAVLNYRVVKTQLYPDNQVDMQAAVTAVTPGKSGLNLITCSGKVKPGTNEFDKRVIVFAEQI